ncbi:MAG TPA: HNH endonuclease signature motif containing protein [Stellaceae bacterium]|jgi:hypothetical protein|nr:HNH endonuclease signature motif containing protein [Stellaceae bacterium]
MCGASPAKDPAVTLHVDHIVPWSKGGETVLSNLQTLCAPRNIGKADQPPTATNAWALVRSGERRLTAGYVILSLALCLAASAGDFAAGLYGLAGGVR